MKRFWSTSCMIALLAVSGTFWAGLAPQPAQAQARIVQADPDDPGDPDPPAPGKAEWTVIYYAAADTDLELFMMDDLREQLQVGSTANVNVVALVDRAVKSEPEKGYTSSAVANIPNWNTAKLFYVNKGSLKELADWGEIDTGDPANLQRLITTVTTSYPANHYSLFVADHGASWPGGFADDTGTDHNNLTLPEIVSALNATKTSYGGRLDLIGFDACLMGNLEVAYALAPYARAMVASEELEPGQGWYYTPSLQQLQANPAMTGFDFGKIISDNFKGFFDLPANAEIKSEGDETTLSVVDLDKVSALKVAVDAVAARYGSTLNQQGRPAWLKLAKIRTTAEQYGRATEEGGEASEVFDLGHMIRLMKVDAKADAAALAELTAAETALKAAVTYSVHGPRRPNASGLSIFFPSDSMRLSSEDPNAPSYNGLTFSKEGKWLGFLGSFTAISQEDVAQPEMAPATVDQAKIKPGSRAKIASSVVADDIEEVSFILAQGEGDNRVIIGKTFEEVQEDGSISHDWDGTWFTLNTKDRHIIAPITDLEPNEGEENSYSAEVPVQLKGAGTEDWLDVTLFFTVTLNNDSAKGEFVYAIKDNAGNMGEIDLEEGDQIRPIYLQLGPNNRFKRVPVTDSSQVLALGSRADLTVTNAPLAQGSYSVGFMVEDFTGNVSLELTKVDVDATSDDVTGDVNGDGKVNISDAIHVLNVAVGLETLTVEEQALADLNGDGKISIPDVILILRKAVGLD